MKLCDKSAIITGAGTGIGKETAKLFYREGASLALFGRRADLLKKVAEETEARYFPCDITREGDVASSVERAYSLYDILTFWLTMRVSMF
jgi:NADP-dependent 3-hydroxy acid dehydrogenase YdfG